MSEPTRTAPSERDEAVRLRFQAAVDENADVMPFLDSEFATVVERLRTRVLDRLIAELGDEMADEILAAGEAAAEETAGETAPPDQLSAGSMDPVNLAPPPPVPAADPAAAPEPPAA